MIEQDPPSSAGARGAGWTPSPAGQGYWLGSHCTCASGDWKCSSGPRFIPDVAQVALDRVEFRLVVLGFSTDTKELLSWVRLVIARYVTHAVSSESACWCFGGVKLDACNAVGVAIVTIGVVIPPRVIARA